MKNVIKLNNYYCPSELERYVEERVEYYNYRRYHESLDNMTPADAYFGRGDWTLRRRREIKLETLKKSKIKLLLVQNFKPKIDSFLKFYTCYAKLAFDDGQRF